MAGELDIDNTWNGLVHIAGAILDVVHFLLVEVAGSFYKKKKERVLPTNCLEQGSKLVVSSFNNSLGH